ncbi:helix-turn-helix domain-containing protein [Clostridium sporogenes]|uniref:helix-turn-helix domain-containing protein n=1 Tax=Clostridium TaxID=1485 RepID=UPI000665C76E|nr:MULTISPECIES: helix-turn-helix domain-containing protein [Clostridium]MCF4018725.1 helix-turn-helix domain-containing protein [Clostridium sporogenes]MDU7251284.1 helix-turn-helix domain-containing protein [Clostridium sp.]NFG01403.1 helix-turn-helix transcriptional regulator [Clostridium sporogenes]NFQ67086.1 helix-turn-helix transcriptional regulator [Clostridium sporogenes]UJA31896.1 helix-turn-helix domain-containing protein [Clostridium sporogenes]
MKFSNLVKLKRTKKNMTLQKLAEVADISSSYISRIENDPTKSPSAESVFKIAKALDISIEDIQDCFGVGLKESDENSSLNLVKQTDYVLIKQAEELMINIANNKEKYDDGIKKLLDITEMLKKPQVKVICYSEEVEYVVNIRFYDSNIVFLVKEILSKAIGGIIRVVNGYFLEYYLEYESQENYCHDLEEFMVKINDFNENGDCDLDLEELSEYLEKIHY